jgi:hypothetical protein
MSKEFIYGIARHGSNGANQSMCERTMLTLVKASSQKRAKEIAAKLYTVYNNQRLEAIPQSKLSQADYLEAQDTPWGVVTEENLVEIEDQLRCW